MISKEEYVLTSVKRILSQYDRLNTNLSSSDLLNLIDQWEFDYEMEKEYRPEVLRERSIVNLSVNNHYCSKVTCDYKTEAKTIEEADLQLFKDGGYNFKKNTSCPKCKEDSLVFLPAKD